MSVGHLCTNSTNKLTFNSDEHALTIIQLSYDNVHCTNIVELIAAVNS